MSASKYDSPDQSTPPDGMKEKFQPVMGEYQLCPKCNGQGTVSKPPYVAGDVNHWASSSSAFQCDVCNGNKIIARPLFNQGEGSQRSVASKAK